MSDKEKNYSDEMVARLHEVYDGEASVDDRRAQVAQLAEELGRSAASVRAKLVREKVYVPYGEAKKAGKVVRKAQIVSAIAAKLNVDEDVMGSLENATKNALVRIYNAL